MKTPYERYLDLVRLGEQDNEEGRTAAHLAFKLAKKHGFALPRDPQAKVEEAGRVAPAQAPPPPNPVWEEKKRAFASIAISEAVAFLKTLNVIPHDIPVKRGAPLEPAARAGRCGCGRSYARGEMVTSERPARCARCVSRG